jgi:hypothetical protein
MTNEGHGNLLVTALCGTAAGALGTAAMDLVEFRRYRIGSGTGRTA